MQQARRSGGFTLIEIMVVVAIIAVMTGAVVLKVDFRNVGTTVRDAAQRTQLLMLLAADEAIYARQQLGIRFHPNNYEFYILSGNEEGQGTWEIIEHPQLKFRDESVEMEFRVDISGLPIVLEELEDEIANASDEDPIKPHVLFLSNGEMMPDFRIIIADKDGEYEHAISTGEVEPVVVEHLN